MSNPFDLAHWTAEERAKQSRRVRAWRRVKEAKEFLAPKPNGEKNYSGSSREPTIGAEGLSTQQALVTLDGADPQRAMRLAWEMGLTVHHLPAGRLGVSGLLKTCLQLRDLLNPQLPRSAPMRGSGRS